MNRLLSNPEPTLIGDRVFEFDGTNDFISNFSFFGGNFMQIQADKTFSSDVWIKSNDLSNTNTIWSRLKLAGGVAVQGVVFYVSSAGSLAFVIFQNLSNYHSAITAAGTITEDKWYHVAVTSNGTNQAGVPQIKLWIDGQDATNSNSDFALGTLSYVNSAQFKIGAQNSGTADANGQTGFFSGRMSQVHFYQDDIGETGIKEVYNDRRGSVAPYLNLARPASVFSLEDWSTILGSYFVKVINQKGGFGIQHTGNRKLSGSMIATGITPVVDTNILLDKPWHGSM